MNYDELSERLRSSGGKPEQRTSIKKLTGDFLQDVL